MVLPKYGASTLVAVTSKIKTQPPVMKTAAGRIIFLNKGIGGKDLTKIIRTVSF